MASGFTKDEILNTNWQEKINNAKTDAERQRYEQARNEKIASKEYQGWGGKQQQTNNYQGSNYRPPVVNRPTHPSNHMNPGAKPYVPPAQNSGNSMGSYNPPKPFTPNKQMGYDPSRRPEFAGMTIQQGRYSVTYGPNGVVQKAKPDFGASATHGIASSHINDSAVHRNMYEAAKRGDWDTVGSLSHGLVTGPATEDTLGDFGAANAYIDELQAMFPGSANNYIGKKYEDVYGPGTWSDPNFSYANQQYNPDYAGQAIQAHQNRPIVGMPGSGIEPGWEMIPGGNGNGGGNVAPGNGGVPGGFGGGSISGDSSSRPSGGGYTPSSGEEYLRQLYEQRRKAEEERLRAAWEANFGQLQQNGDLIGREYADKRNQAAAQNDLQRMQMAELAAAQGLNTGATGQMALGQSAAYQGVMGGLFDQEAADQTALNNAIAQLKQQYLAQLNSAQAGIDADLNSALYQEFVRQQEAAEAARRQAIEDQRWQMQWEAQQEQQRWENQFAQDQWNAKQQAMMAQAAPTTTQTGGSDRGNGGGNVLDEHVDTGRGYDNGGLSREQVIQLQNAIGVNPDGLWGSASSSTAGDLAGSRGDGSPLTAQEAWQLWGGGVEDFGNLTRTLQGLMATGEKKFADAFVKKYWDQLNLSQANEWDTMINRFYGK